MKTFLIHLLGFLLGMLLAPLYGLGVTAWIWLPIMFSMLNFFGSFWLGLIIGLVITVGTEIIKDKFICD